MQFLLSNIAVFIIKLLNVKLWELFLVIMHVMCWTKCCQAGIRCLKFGLSQGLANHSAKI